MSILKSLDLHNNTYIHIRKIELLQSALLLKYDLMVQWICIIFNVVFLLLTTRNCAVTAFNFLDHMAFNFCANTDPRSVKYYNTRSQKYKIFLQELSFWVSCVVYPVIPMFPCKIGFVALGGGGVVALRI